MCKPRSLNIQGVSSDIIIIFNGVPAKELMKRVYEAKLNMTTFIGDISTRLVRTVV